MWPNSEFLSLYRGLFESQAVCILCMQFPSPFMATELKLKLTFNLTMKIVLSLWD